jgi:hypothetical protein
MLIVLQALANLLYQQLSRTLNVDIGIQTITAQSGNYGHCMQVWRDVVYFLSEVSLLIFLKGGP